jgi:hypothetical protein
LKGSTRLLERSAYRQRQCNKCGRLALARAVREGLILPRLPNPAVHHIRLQTMGQSNTADAGARLLTLSHRLRLESLAVFTPARPAIG